MSLATLTTEELLQLLANAGLDITEDERRKFIENEVDGETVDHGLTEAMIAYLFEKSFKKQLKFRDFVQQNKEVSFNLEVLPPSPAVEPMFVDTPAPSKQNRVRLPAIISIPRFPNDVQHKLDAKEPCHKVSKYRNTIVRTLYEMMSQYTMFPSNQEYVQVAKALILKYPFLKDIDGTGYHTWHMSLKRKFKTERAPLVDDAEVKKYKDKYAQSRKSKAMDGSAAAGPKQARASSELAVIGEDSTSIEAHVRVLKEQYKKMQPDMVIVKDRMTRTFTWRRREIVEGISVEDLITTYPFLTTSSGLYDEVDSIHPAPVPVYRRIRENLSAVLPKLLSLVKDSSPLKIIYLDARNDALAEEHAAIDTRGGIALLPSIFKEKIENLMILGQGEPNTPYPTIQVKVQDWKTAIARKAESVIVVDGVKVCSCIGIEEAFIAAFCMYFVLNMEYPSHLKNTMAFFQRSIAQILLNGEKLSTPVTRIINLLY
ncbi:sterile alpha motif domain-containing protein 3-like [Paramormyrops kingsleyae]|uniref:sterile alpha motif domain-containing protein 3-like n=1 Tax=Paramormyrops kingsleyae TaxID=1676925 RepID=UPI000CD6137E|nr:uncharacterized protein LOC111835877 [Paramormyrops kingsleyae]